MGRCPRANLSGRRRSPGPLSALRWNPHVEHHVLAVAGREGVYLVDTKTARGDDREATKALLEGEDDEGVIDSRPDARRLSECGPRDSRPCTIVKCALAAPARTVAWHAGATTSVPSLRTPSRRCVVHRCSRRSSQAPPQKGRQGGPDPELLCLSPVEALSIRCFSRTTVRLYLARQELVKTLRSGCK